MFLDDIDDLDSIDELDNSDDVGSSDALDNSDDAGNSDDMGNDGGNAHRGAVRVRHKVGSFFFHSFFSLFPIAYERILQTSGHLTYF